LMPVGAGELLQLLIVTVDDVQAGFFDFLQELLHALIATARINVQFFDGFGRDLQSHGDGMEAK